MLSQQGKAVRVVSMPSVEVFAQQASAYRESVLPRAITARIAVEAGSGDLWYKYVGSEGRVIALDRFGESAPAAEAFPHLGFSVDNIVAQAMELFV